MSPLWRISLAREWPGAHPADAAAVNFVDDGRNPPETAVRERALEHIKNAKLLLVLASTDTSGRVTTVMAKFWASQLKELLEAAPERGM